MIHHPSQSIRPERLNPPQSGPHFSSLVPYAARAAQTDCSLINNESLCTEEILTAIARIADHIPHSDRIQNTFYPLKNCFCPETGVASIAYGEMPSAPKGFREARFFVVDCFRTVTTEIGNDFLQCLNRIYSAKHKTPLTRSLMLPQEVHPYGIDQYERIGMSRTSLSLTIRTGEEDDPPVKFLKGYLLIETFHPTCGDLSFVLTIRPDRTLQVDRPVVDRAGNIHRSIIADSHLLELNMQALKQIEGALPR